MGHTSSSGDVMAALQSLRDSTASGFERNDRRFEKLEVKLGGLEAAVAIGFERVDRRLGNIETRVEGLEARPSSRA